MTDQDNSPGLSTEQRERVVAAANLEAALFRLRHAAKLGVGLADHGNTAALTRDDTQALVDHFSALQQENERLRKAVKLVRSIIADGAPTGFNPLEGDWAERLFRSQWDTLAALQAPQSQGIGYADEGERVLSPDLPSLTSQGGEDHAG